MKVPDNFRLIYPENEIQEAVKRLAAEISPWCEGEKTVLVYSLMNGALFFTADLLRALTETVELSALSFHSYTDDGVREKGTNIALGSELQGRSVLVIDDICDSGETLQEIVTALKGAGVKEVRSAVLLKRILDGETFEPDYVGIRHNGTEWFVGYGMDSHGLWRNLPDLYVIEH